MAARNIPKDQWHPFFERFTKTIQDQRQADVEIASLEYGDQLLAEKVSLHGLSYDAKGGIFEVEMANINHRVIRPAQVFVDWEAGGVIGVEVVGDDDVRTILRIREPLMLPEPQGAWSGSG